MDRRKTLAVLSGVLASLGAASAEAAEGLRPILVIGATAHSAPEILKQALEQGRKVIAFARSPERIEIKDSKLKVVKGDAYDLDSMAAAMTGKETVISLIGPAVDPTKEVGFVDLYSVGIATIVAAMKRKGNKRLIALSSAGTEQIPSQAPTNGDPVDEFVWRERNLYGDMQRMEKIIAVSGLEWIVLRPRGLGNGPKLNNLKLKVHEHGSDFAQYKSMDARTPAPASHLTHADLADFILKAVDANKYLGTSVGIYTDISD
jgi:putative NADH-flavin reductase